MGVRIFTYHNYCFLVLNFYAKKIKYIVIVLWLHPIKKPIDNNDRGWWY